MRSRGGNGVAATAICLLLCLGCRPGGTTGVDREPPAGPHVWAAPAACRVFPVGQESPDVSPELLRKMKQGSSIWNATDRRIVLRGIRRETVDFQLIIERGDAPELTGVQVIATPLSDGRGRVLKAAPVFLLEGYVEEGGRFYPDILAPFEAGKVHPFDVPHRVAELAEVPGQHNQAVWVDLAVPADAAPGIYRGTIDVRAEGRRPDHLALEMEVLDIELPAEPSADIVLDTYSGIIRHLKIADDQRMRALERQFYRLAREHRMFVNVIRYPQRGVPPADVLPKFSRDGQGKLTADWSSWDLRYGGYLDGTAFADGRPIEQFCLEFNQFWPAGQWPTADFLEGGDPSPAKRRYEQAWMEHAAEYIRHIKEKGWNKTRFTIKMNHYQRPGQNFPLIWNTDCPRNAADFKAVAYFADLTHRAFKVLAPRPMAFRVDTGHSFCRDAGCDWPIWDQVRAADSLAGVDLCFFEWDHALSHPNRLGEVRRSGKKVYAYKHGWDCTSSSPIFRGLGWILWSAGLDGYNAYNHPHDNLKRRRDGLEWDNYTMYVGWDGANQDAFPSIRLKLQRDSLVDYELLKLAAKAAPTQVAAVVARAVQLQRPVNPGAAVTFAKPVLPADPEAFASLRGDLLSLCNSAGK